MKRKCYSITPFWDKRFIKKDLDLNPILITVNSKRSQFRIGVKLYSTKADFDAATKTFGGNEKIRELRKDINQCISKAEEIFELLIKSTKETFLRLYKHEMDLPIFKGNKTSVVFVFKKICELIGEKRIGTASNYSYTLKSLLNINEYFEDIDINFERVQLMNGSCG